MVAAVEAVEAVEAGGRLHARMHHLVPEIVVEVVGKGVVDVVVEGGFGGVEEFFEGGAAMVSGGELPCGQHELVRHLDSASAALVQEARDMASAHPVQGCELRRASAQQLRQRFARCLQRVAVLHEQPVMQVGPNLQRILHSAMTTKSSQSPKDLSDPHRLHTPKISLSDPPDCRCSQTTVNPQLFRDTKAEPEKWKLNMTP